MKRTVLLTRERQNLFLQARNAWQIGCQRLFNYLGFCLQQRIKPLSS